MEEAKSVVQKILHDRTYCHESGTSYHRHAHKPVRLRIHFMQNSCSTLRAKDCKFFNGYYCKLSSNVQEPKILLIVSKQVGKMYKEHKRILPQLPNGGHSIAEGERFSGWWCRGSALKERRWVRSIAHRRDPSDCPTTMPLVRPPHLLDHSGSIS